MDADIARAAMVNGIVKATVDAMTDEEAVLSPDSISKIWGTVFGEPVDEPIAPPPINWLTNMKPDTDTVEQRAAFLKKEGLACPTEITPDDVEAIGRVR
jgi:hypothetical protein